jgi:predicted O-linked N-acetylglucosamine transferase (SPINDLY family)
VVTSLVDLARSVCDWETASAAAVEAMGCMLDRTSGTTPVLSPFTALKLPLSPDVHRLIAERYVTAFHPVTADAPTIRDSTPERLRLGYLSADFRNHPVMHLGSRLFEHHDRRHFEVRCYSIGPDDFSPQRRHVEDSCDAFVDLWGSTDEASIRRLRADRLDVLVDMTGHTAFSRFDLLAARPAPVQVHFLGYPGTTGASFIDWFITDGVLTPPDHRQHFCERLVEMPYSYQINDELHEVPASHLTRQDYGLPKDAVVFCCFNSTYKNEPGIFEVWLNILRQVPRSVLWIVPDNRFVANRLRASARAHAIDDRRLVFAERVGRLQHLTRYRLGDLSLDTHVVGGHTTTSDSIRMGVPVVTSPRATFISRVSASVLSAIGVPELICADLTSYERTAVQLANVGVARKELRQRVETGRDTSPVFDPARFVRSLEAAYQSMWRLASSGRSDANIRILPSQAIN